MDVNVLTGQGWGRVLVAITPIREILNIGNSMDQLLLIVQLLLVY